MGNTLTEIANQLITANKKVQLIYAFNGTGKTRLSCELKDLVDPKMNDSEEADTNEKVLYYNAFTEDLFYWDNDLDGDIERKLKIQPNAFTDWVLVDQGQESNIISHFQRYTNDKLTPRFNEEYTYINSENKEVVVKPYSEVTFSIDGGNDKTIKNIKISKGEESNFVWCVFYSLLEQVVEVLNTSEPVDRVTDQFDDLKYVFIDDPVSSLDDSHLIELAVNLANLIESSKSDLKFVVTTHNALFYNVLCNEFNGVSGVVKKHLKKLEDATYILVDSNDSPFSYHLYLLAELDEIIASGNIRKYHFNLLRNILEKTATFLGYKKWKYLLPDGDAREVYYNRIIHFSSHSKHHGEEIAELEEQEKNTLIYLVSELKKKCGFKTIETKNP